MKEDCSRIKTLLKQNETLNEIKKILSKNDFCRVFITIGLIAFTCNLVYESGKIIGKLIANL